MSGPSAHLTQIGAIHVTAFPGCSFPTVGALKLATGVAYRVWAPEAAAVRVIVTRDGEEHEFACEREHDGFHLAFDPEGKAGDRYLFALDDSARLPDPASRFQPEGVDGPSEVVDPARYRWQSELRHTPSLRGRVIYELHVGTFTREGTFRAAIDRLDALVDLGVNAIEIMPIADFAGRWNWGYDGVMLFAPARCYGQPDDFRALVDAAHQRGLAVILDVVYNHLGPCGNVLPRFSSRYLHPERQSFWGQALNFDGEGSGPVRQFFLQNVCLWLDDYRVDGLRLDAVHAIQDDSPEHIISQIAAAARHRGAFTIAEDERNDSRIITPRERGGWGVVGMWADDFHHTIRVSLTGQREAHFKNYSGRTDEWVETLRHGWLYRGQHFPSWGRPRGTPTTQLSPEQFVWCISNHDQVGNRPLGDRLHDVVPPAAYRAASMLLCLAPYTPMLFMGQEWAATSPFPFFTDHPGDVGRNMAGNRLNEFRHNEAHYPAEVLDRMPDPQAESTFRSSYLNWDERDKPPHATVLALYRGCLHLRSREPAFHAAARGTWSAQKIGASGAIGLRWRDPKGDWLLLVRLTAGVCDPGDDPLIQLPHDQRWQLILSSEDIRFGGEGQQPAPDDTGQRPRLTAPAAALFRATR